MNDDKQELIKFLNIFSLKTGKEFTLSSGQKSNIYIDVKQTAFDRKGSKLLARLLHQEMMKKFHHTLAVAGVVLGGCHLASIVSMQDTTGLEIIYVRKETKGHGTQNLVEMSYYANKVVILEDVITTGASAMKAARLIEREGLEVLGIIAVVDRRPNKTETLSDDNGEINFKALVNFEELSP